MNDYSDIIFLMGAMIVFSMLTVQTFHLFQMNNQVKINGEVEYNAIAVAQDQVDKLRWARNETEFDTLRSQYPKTVRVPVQNESMNYNVGIDVNQTTIPNSNVDTRKITIEVTNKYMKNRPNAADGSRSVKLEFLKSFEN
ncbi:hypothetical protein [Fodinibius halophilus]|uniref:Type II secretion system protein n=1 Tax=Fodinibius halophilus TaxID=1736908 RepID=A0A6M1TGN1_9BACT|nr:hypothetical protein [Fodinibius halophilus]NGP87820.1 hypothetical protein [Fodinibius halophilus]